VTSYKSIDGMSKFLNGHNYLLFDWMCDSRARAVSSSYSVCDAMIQFFKWIIISFFLLVTLDCFLFPFYLFIYLVVFQFCFSFSFNVEFTFVCVVPFALQSKGKNAYLS